MIFTLARAGRKSHAWEVTQTIRVTLILCNTSITDVMIAVWPQAVSGCSIARPSEIAHSPNTWPKANRIATPR